MRLRAVTGPDGPQRAGAAEPHPCDTRLAAWTLGWLFIAGATIGLVSLILPHPPRADIAGLYSNVLLAYVGGAACLLTVDRWRPWMIQVALATGALLVTRAVLLSGESDSFYAVWYIWVGLYAFYFCTRRAAAAQVSFAALLYGATLAHSAPSSPVARFLTTVATLVVAGAVIDALVRRVRREASVAAGSAATMARVTELAHRLSAISASEPARIALCEGALRVAGAVRVALWEPCGDGTGLRVAAAAGIPGGLAEASFTGPTEGVIRAFTGGELVSEATQTPPSPLASLWCPIEREQKVAGVLELTSAAGAHDGQTAVATARLLAAEAGVTLVRVALLETLERVARTDELTGLPNRRAWQERLALEIGRAEREGERLAVAMLDLDHFKRFNDTYGHQSGDRLLKQVAGAWLGALRPTDVLARYGGEEFSLALPVLSAEEAVGVIERLRAAIPDGQSCSAGIALWDGREEPSELLERADHALYRAKRLGRNRSTLAADAREATDGLASPTRAQ